MMKATIELTLNYHDMSAALAFPPSPPLPVHEFFKEFDEDGAPFKTIPNMSKKTSLDVNLQKAHDEWSEDQTKQTRQMQMQRASKRKVWK